VFQAAWSTSFGVGSLGKECGASGLGNRRILKVLRTLADLPVLIRPSMSALAIARSPADAVAGSLR